jgi:hypothetical protein
MFRKIVIMLAAALALGVGFTPTDASAQWRGRGWRGAGWGLPAPLWGFYPYYRPYYRGGYYPFYRGYRGYRGYYGYPYGARCWRFGWC